MIVVGQDPPFLSEGIELSILISETDIVNEQLFPKTFRLISVYYQVAFGRVMS